MSVGGRGRPLNLTPCKACCHLHVLVLQPYHAENLQEAIFKSFDVDEDGWLSPEEFLSLMKATNPGEPVDMKIAKGTLYQLAKTSLFKDRADFDKGLTLEGLELSYSKMDGNDVDEDAKTLGWL